MSRFVRKRGVKAKWYCPKFGRVRKKTTCVGRITGDSSQHASPTATAQSAKRQATPLLSAVFDF